MSATPVPPVPTLAVWSDSLLAYNFGAHHPMSPIRLELTARLADEYAIFHRPNVTLAAAESAGDAELETVHDPAYVAAVKAVSDDPTAVDEARGLGTEDDPVFAGMHAASARIAGASLQSASAILDGSALHAVNFAGGMHHAARGKASGFCIYNDCALAIQRLLDGGVQRVAYVDVDAHHGDGVQSIFYDDPRVLTISLHETGTHLFPGTGFANESGGPEALGSSVNVALPPRSGDAAFLRAFHAVVPQLVRAFAPEVIVSQHGCDNHARDMLSSLRLSIDAQRQMMLDMADLAREVAGDRWIATGGGGYDVFNVVPRSWTHMLAIVSGRPIPLHSEVPQSWHEYVEVRYGQQAPLYMGDDADLWWRSWEVGYDPNDSVDRTVMATRKEIFPYHGLDPWFD
ncbi:acetoin utilization protein AcuC [Arthrobacter sp. CAU 1506]|uniref:acetoin utilization protein AcuC n=1 Tax=Arthrobacter sp. CAU 1506 TaxID=2560052 RepID=UPI0010AD446D|nr:acetoin utilization protein AcuC [Arthrobacter sp. CAU 1506]TJY69867.1 acetoin utilization protein AcuC [Arthrobacter sp. CAU 1506]